MCSAGKRENELRTDLLPVYKLNSILQGRMCISGFGCSLWWGYRSWGANNWSLKRILTEWQWWWGWSCRDHCLLSLFRTQGDPSSRWIQSWSAVAHIDCLPLLRRQWRIHALKTQQELSWTIGKYSGVKMHIQRAFNYGIFGYLQF